ncbi:unnamed protein product [Eruca vesicaria subsp. sativa]|uniref:Uncharacterized protein n=1 Tax=Eruca vesicaria subsp. sativa TaxID=29727 RepID=A0ABC8IVH8_ERUVS|nr:unnamed protein product [Eruca vesicaria subsp. sativa]
MGSCKVDIFVAQDLNFTFGNLLPLNETLKDRAFESGGGSISFSHFSKTGVMELKLEVQQFLLKAYI